MSGYVTICSSFNKVNITKRFLLFFICFAVFGSIWAQKPVKGKYQFSVDLTQLTNDKLQVTLVPPVLKKGKAIYRLPKMIPGTYAIYDFGRFVSDFTALDAAGASLPVKKLDDNNWEITNAEKLAKVTYNVEDTWDTDQKDKFVFEVAGSDFERDSVFAWNANCLFGYFDQLKNYGYTVNVTKPAGFYGATSLVPATTSATTDVWQTENYMDLVDAPILYTRPDTTSFTVGGCQILVSVYSPTKKITAKGVSQSLVQIIEAAKNYLGGQLPVKKYAFLIYTSPNPYKSRLAGALEHSYSSFYALMEAPEEQMAEQVRDVASHEFFHIVTPLSIHAEEIGNFDYIKPEMSKHLWLYEGVTEYNAHLSQMRSGILKPEEFVATMAGKMRGSDRFGGDSIPFTEQSKGALDKHASYYGNVYQKGALIGMCLDLKLRKLSGGKYGIQNLLADLAKTYGKQKSFKDAELFDAITKLTYPEIRSFFSKYVEGAEPLPFAEVLSSVGVNYAAKVSEQRYTHGLSQDIVTMNQSTGRLEIANRVARFNPIAKELAFTPGDQILKFNGENFELARIQALLGGFMASVKDGDPIEWVVLRKDAEGKEAEVTLSVKAHKVEMGQTHVAKLAADATPEQVALRKAWLQP